MRESRDGVVEKERYWVSAYILCVSELFDDLMCCFEYKFD